MDSITELPPAHIPLSSFPAATALAAQGVSRPPSPSSDKQSPYSTRPPSPNYLYLESGASSVIDYDSSYPPTPSEPASRDSSWGPPGTRSASRSKDPLFKRSLRGAENRSSLLSRWLGTTVREEEEERRGRRLSIGEAMGASVTGAPLQPSAKGRRWIASREGAQKILAFAMIGLVGMNDSATGANLSSMQAFYGVSYDRISIVFLSNVAGYFSSCLTSPLLTHHLGLRWSLVLAAAFMGGGCLILCLAPPFAAFVVSLALLGFGGGLFDSALTTVISHEEDEVSMSLMYSFFGIGAMFSPLIVGGFIDNQLPWNYFYYVPLSITVFLGILAFFVFSTYTAPSDEVRPSAPAGDIELTSAGDVVSGRAVMSVRTRMRRALGMRAVWVGFFLVILAFGTSDTLSAWMVSFMVEKRNSPEAASRYQLAGLWAGIALGRVVLAYLGRRLGERTFSIAMLTAASACLAVVYGVRNVAADACFLALTGFFIGPVTPKVLSTVSARVPPSLKSSVMSLTIGLGLIGSAAGPLAFGVVAGKGYLSSLPAVLIGASAIAALGWTLVPRNVRRED